MPRAKTRASSRGKFQYQELSLSNPRRRRTRTSLSLVRGVITVNIPLRSVSTPFVARTQPRLPSTLINRTLVYMA